MERLIIILVLLLTFSVQVNAQQEKGFKYFEDTTLELYRQEAWQPLIKTGKEALHAGIDYYYLRMRIGIAYYELKRYRQSIAHFNKALKMNSGSSDAAEYLFYALGYSGSIQERNLFYHKHKTLLQDEVKFEEKEFIDYLHFNGGWKLSEGILEMGDQSFFKIGMGYRLFGGKLHLYHAYQKLAQGYNYIVDTIRRGPRLYERWSSIKYNQYEYYINPTLQFRKGFKISAASHWQWVDMIGEILTNYVWSLNASKAWAFWEMGIQGSYAFINEDYLQQAGLNLTLYPLGNNNLYFNTDGNLILRYEEQDPEPVVTGKLGFLLFPQTWLEGMITQGDIYNFQENNGAVVYNSPDRITSRWGLQGIHYNANGHRFSLSYILEKKSSAYYDGNFTHHAIVGDILINF